MKPASAPVPSESLSSELEDFRTQWLQDLKISHSSKPEAALHSPAPPPPAAVTEEVDVDTIANPDKIPEPAPAEDAQSSSEEEEDDDENPGTAFGATMFEYESQRKKNRELVSALDHFEEAIKKEAHGNLGDSLNLYRKAFRMDSTVDKKYRQKHFPSTAKGPVTAPPTHAPASKAPPIASNSTKTAAITAAAAATTTTTIPTTTTATSATAASAANKQKEPAVILPIADLIASFAYLQITPAPPDIEGEPSPPCPIADVPYEILFQILDLVAAHDIADFSRLSLVCKRLAYIVATEERIWRSACLSFRFGFSAMYYAFHRTLDGCLAATLDPLTSEAQYEAHTDARRLARTQKVCAALLKHKPYNGSWRQLFRLRPRLRFNGCYISRVNYLRDGQAAPNQKTWHSTVHVVTYFRYLRFLRDGTVYSLLTTDEPTDIVPLLTCAMLRDRNQAHPMLANLLCGRWRMADPLAAEPARRFADDVTVAMAGGKMPFEVDGDVVVETDGIVPKYKYLLQLAVRPSGKRSVNNKIVWNGFWSHHTEIDRWSAFPLKNEKPYIFSRVKAFGFGES
ncbi:hypothetical protein TD95_000074 [Thielaviopsis punctulata]|uniref:F-box domain-containing protein n=1 Tax=Thielaviopsis punctulata TaxID=72032 RepID=A0A0F4Z7Z3_9PEZI|nr:hypothetical protein TD95_000074 [Thielaviopsis punctulata]